MPRQVTVRIENTSKMSQLCTYFVPFDAVRPFIDGKQIATPSPAPSGAGSDNRRHSASQRAGRCCDRRTVV
jgi:hypothetical protein